MLSDWLSGRWDYAGFVLGAGALFGALAWGLRSRRRTPAHLSRVFWLGLVALVLAGFFFVEEAGRRPQRRLITMLEGIAPTYASELERMGHAELELETAAEDPRYLEMIETLKRWERLNPLVSDIYTFRRAPDGGVVLLVDAETDYDGDGRFIGAREARTRPGERYPQADESIFRAFEGERTFQTTPMTDRWGTWVSANVPMRDADGRVEAVLGVDYPAELWTEETMARRRVALLYLGVMVLILAGSGAVVALDRAELASRAAAEARLRTSDARLRAMMDHLPFALWLLDADGICRAHNARAATTRAASEGKTLAELDFEEAERVSLEEDCRRARAGSVITRETACGSKGRPRHLFRLLAPVVEAPHRTGLVAVELDVTDRVEAEQARRRSEQRLALHVQQMPLAYIEWGPDRRVLRWNPAAERIFGYTVHEAVGRPFDELIVPETAVSEVDAVCRLLFERKGGTQHINENRTKDGRVITCEWTNTPLVDSAGQVIAVASHANDITERVALEERLRQTQRMESMGQLAGGVAHEFNNLLTPMLMQVGQIAATHADDQKLIAMLRPVEDSILQAAQLNQRILAVGRKTTDTPGLQNLNPLVEAAVDLLRHTLDRRIELAVELAAGLPPALLTKGAVTQVVMNLALNARDALLARLERGAPSGWTPRLTVATRYLAHAPASAPAGLRRAPGCLVLTVTDNGEGMSAEVRGRAFEPFFTTKAPGKGTGLGLAVVWNVVEGLGGSIDLRTAPGAGASFVIHLPVARPEDVPTFSDLPAPKAAPIARAPSLRVLLVEDNELVRDTFREVMSQAGHEVVLAIDGEAGLRRLEEAGERPFDVLVADLNMPRLSGRGMIERARAASLLPRGVIVVSGLVDPGLSEELTRLGVDRVLRKPLPMADLLAAVHEVGRKGARPDARAD
jgi:PAS domain S-box-containing protein